MNPLYRRLRQKAIELEKTRKPPRFYIQFRREIELSSEFLTKNSLLRECINPLRLEQEGMGHGFAHSKAVAIEAGALVMIDAERYSLPEGEIEEAVFAVHIAGLLHDIKRGSEDHAVQGSQEASKILDCFGIEERLKRAIVIAIRNHEAFKKTTPLNSSFEQLISDALYDADKFRWGPDNFTTTIWQMLEYGNIDPAEFLGNYQKGIDYIERVKETFRTPTGRVYGPEIIETGLKIGQVIYEELKSALM
jgi:hypothetical protein